MHMVFPKFIQEILNILHSAGYEAYLVGGCVRDAILGCAPEDWDITTNALPQQVIHLFPRCIPTGIQHGTVTIVYGKNETAEVTTYRTDGIYEDGRHPKQISFAKSLEEDLSRRDFTMNAIAFSPATGFVDLFQGQSHIVQKRICCVGDPQLRFSEDALRMLRALRFSAVLGFTVDAAILEAIEHLHANIEKVSIERIQMEFSKMLLAKHVTALQLLFQTGLLAHFLPEVTKAFSPVSWENIPARLPCRLAVFLQDIPPETASGILKRLRYSNHICNHTCSILKNMELGLPQTETAIRHRLATKALQSGFSDYLEITGAKKIYSLLEEIQRRGDCTSLFQLAVNGNDLTSLGITNGKQKGTILQELLQAVLENPALNTREQLMKIALEKR